MLAICKKGCLAAGVLLALAGFGYGTVRLIASPGVALLSPEQGAQWILFDAQPELKAQTADRVVTCFRAQFRVDTDSETAKLTFRAMKAAKVLLDGQALYETEDGGIPLGEAIRVMSSKSWKQLHIVPLALSRGAHELEVFVRNSYGPACLLAWCPELNLATNSDWDATQDGMIWTSALEADAPNPAGLSRRFGKVSDAFFSVLPFVAAVFMFVFAAVLGRKRLPERIQRILGCARFWRWVFIGAWAALALNNLFKLPLYVGFDVDGHMDYINFVADNWRLPLATEGWTMFQAPLYYLIAGALNGVLKLVLTDSATAHLLRVLSLACGMAQIEICYRALRHVWPDREDLQIAGTLFAAFLPMNLYMSQFIGNEPLTGCLVGLVVLLCLKYLSNPESGQTTTAVLLLGLVLGMAGLAKMTALGMLPAVFLMLVIVWSNAGARPRTERVTLLIAACAVVFSLAFLVCGWFYVRNWLVLGRPFWGGWEPERQILWWQYPGYRTFAQFARFGECMTYPILSGLNSLWDGFYSTLWLDGYTSSMVDPDFPPPWNFDFMLSGAWLALVPSLVMGGGLAAVFLTKEAALRRIGVFATSCLVLYIAALVYGFLTVPYYCVVKASYTLGLVPCYAILLTAGLRLCRTPVVKGIVLGGLAAWGAAAYAAYFIL